MSLIIGDAARIDKRTSRACLSARCRRRSSISVRNFPSRVKFSCAPDNLIRVTRHLNYELVLLSVQRIRWSQPVIAPPALTLGTPSDVEMFPHPAFGDAYVDYFPVERQGLFLWGKDIPSGKTRFKEGFQCTTSSGFPDLPFSDFPDLDPRTDRKMNLVLLSPASDEHTSIGQIANGLIT